tara:strand:+ start:16 stop:294 length:279 start_codon:yes stop_codon:yes gene_type:complete
MAKDREADKPLRADYRILKNFYGKYCPDAVHIKAEYDKISQVFQKAGGSWKGFFCGAYEHIVLLKQVVKTAYKKGHITKAGMKEDQTRAGRG